MPEGGKGIGIVLVFIGGVFLLGQFINIDVGSFAWPFFILVPGLIMLAAAFLGNDASNLAVPGSIVSMVGLILFIQNITGRFETWAYVWALIPVAVGIGLYIQGNIKGNQELQRSGRRSMTTGLALLVVFGVFFELLIFNNVAGSFAWRYGLPIILIVGGAYLLMARQRHQMQEPPSPPKPNVQ